MRSLFPHQFTLLFINSFTLSVIRKNALSTNYTLEQRFQILMPVSKMKVESEKVGLKLNIQKTKIMASGPITSWQIDGEAMETVRLYFWGLQNHCNGDCSHEIKRRLLLGRKVMTNLDSILKSRDTLLCQQMSV